MNLLCLHARVILGLRSQEVGVRDRAAGTLTAMVMSMRLPVSCTIGVKWNGMITSGPSDTRTSDEEIIILHKTKGPI